MKNMATKEIDMYLSVYLSMIPHCCVFWKDSHDPGGFKTLLREQAGDTDNSNQPQ